MLYYLFEFLEREFNVPGAGLFQYITFRAGGAIVLSLIISMIFGKRIISSLKRLQVGEAVRDLNLAGQKEKEGTPTMGGFIIILAVIIPCLLFAKLDNIYIITLLISTVWLMLIGFADDYIKVFRKDKAGLKGTTKIIGQVGLGIFVGAVMLFNNDISIRMPLAEAQAGGYEIVKEYKTTLPAFNASPVEREYAYVKTTLTNVPFFKGNSFDYKYLVSFFGDNADLVLTILFILIVIFIITAMSNAANLTDGLDGLAAGVSAIIAGTIGIMAYVSGNSIVADYLNIFFIPNSAEIVIYAACLLGGCVGFLWYNAFPAKVFMGDTGSLTIGGVIAVMAILLRKELILPVLCGIFVVESLSVMIQVGYFKRTKKKYGEGRRVFLMSPIHHHFQKKGMHESKIAVRFWIVGILLAIVTVMSLKVR